MTTRTNTFKPVQLCGGTFAAMAQVVVSRIRQVVMAVKHRRDIAILASFDDRMLADIGLNRSDLREAFGGPMWRDPTALLVNRVAARRLWRPRLSRRSPRAPAAR